MTGRARWLRFNAVGLAGAAVQLGSLRVLESCVGGHYLVASAAALEITLLHNFWWHRRVTWADRRGGWWGQMARFQAANGAVSLAGNLLLMRVLVGGLGMLLLEANAVAILGCSVVNFALSEWWAFGVEGVGIE